MLLIVNPRSLNAGICGCCSSQNHSQVRLRMQQRAHHWLQPTGSTIWVVKAWISEQIRLLLAQGRAWWQGDSSKLYRVAAASSAALLLLLAVLGLVVLLPQSGSQQHYLLARPQSHSQYGIARLAQQQAQLRVARGGPRQIARSLWPRCAALRDQLKTLPAKNPLFQQCTCPGGLNCSLLVRCSSLGTDKGRPFPPRSSRHAD